MNSHLNNAFTTELEPSVFYLGQNYPNPFKEKTKIKFCVASTTRITLTVYNDEGKVIKKLVDEEKDPGTYEVEFSACHSCESGHPEEGTYFYRLVAGDYKNKKKMSIQK
jgi:5-hydroxyisourate hydrolase-like protein (transthyretin family)